MARTNRVKVDGDAWYHVMSRTNDRRFLFEGGRVKSELLDALRRAAAFSGVRLGACVAMDNHFHAVVKVEAPSAPVGAEELLRRVGALKGAEAARRLSERWGRLEASGLAAALEAERGRLRARMHDVSEFVKTFKEEFDRAFKRGRPYCGSVWSGRFASTLVEGGEYLRRCVKYVLHNPVRAGLVSQAKDYAWSWCAPDMLPGAGTGPMSGPAPVGTGPAGEGEGRLAEAGAAGTEAGPVAGADAARAGGDVGTGPGGWWLRRVAKVGAGKVFGSAGFVLRTASALGDRFRARGVGAHPVGEIGFSTHGWRLARAGVGRDALLRDRRSGRSD